MAHWVGGPVRTPLRAQPRRLDLLRKLLLGVGQAQRHAPLGAKQRWMARDSQARHQILTGNRSKLRGFHEDMQWIAVAILPNISILI